MDKKIATVTLAGALVAPGGLALAQQAGNAVAGAPTQQESSAPQTPWADSGAAVSRQNNGVYDLGQLHVTAPTDQSAARASATAGIPFQPTTTPPLGGDTITAKKIEAFDRATLDRAAELTPGVVSDNLAGPRNEQNIYVHGFDRWQVPLYLDGVRIYLPADNRLDFGRFLTGGLSEIQISKGYSSVLDGPGGMGGQINLVTRKPTKPVEASIGTQIDMGSSGYLGQRSFAMIGTRQDLYYLLASGVWDSTVGFDLPQSFTPTVNQGSGLRNHSNSSDTSLNLKAGYTPNATDEYSINFLRQDGAKGVPYSVSWPIASQRNWVWPFWNTQSLALNTHTAIDDTTYVNSKIFWNRMDNSIDSFSNTAQTLQNNAAAFNSAYHDWSLGASIEVGKQILPWDSVKAALHYRRDTHNEDQDYFVNSNGTTKGCFANIVCYSEPRVTSMEDTFSAAIENTIHVNPIFDLVQGFGYDWRDTLQARGFNSSTAPYSMIYYPTGTSVAPNIQGAAILRYNDTDKAYFFISDRARFPTLFERYSTRFGLAIANPDLQPERATNFQLGWDGLLMPKMKVSTDVYYSIINDMIQTVGITIPGKGATTQSDNVGLGHAYGLDLKVDYAIRDDLAVGGQLGLIHRYINSSVLTNPNVQLIGVPGATAMIYANWLPVPNLTLTPNVQFASDRWSPNYNTTAYVQTGAYVLVNFKAEYQVTPHFNLFAGGNNLTDRLYSLTDGYPEAGRMLYVGAKATF
jgi:iron complex outermembrane receptor protein